MKRLFLTLLTALILSTPTQASSLIVYGGNLSDDDKIAIDTLLREYTGPGAAHFINHPEAIDDPKFAQLFSDESFAEEKFMRNMVQSKYPGVNVRSIPTTLWDTTVARLWLTDLDLNKKYNEIGALEKAEERKREHILRYFDISAEIGKNFGANEEQNLKKYLRLVVSNLSQIAKSALSNRYREWVNSLTNEYRKFMYGIPSVLINLIDEEFAAARDNKFMIVRATGGAELGLNQNPRNDQLIDFPTKTYGSIVKQINSIKNNIIDVELKPDELFQFSSGLSYSTSYLGGFLFDSYSEIISACTFTFYARGEDYIVYTLFLDKKWMFPLGRHMFRFDQKGLYTDAIFGAREDFHPRMLRILPRPTPETESTTFYGHQGISTNLIGKDPNCKYGDFDIRIADERVKKHATIILQQLAKNAEFLTHARVIAIRKHVLSKPNETAEAQELIANQKVALETLLEHIRK